MTNRANQTDIATGGNVMDMDEADEHARAHAQESSPTPEALELPPEIAAFIGTVFAPAVAAFLLRVFDMLARVDRTERALRTRVDVLEAKVDDFLQDGQGSHAYEPERLSAIRERLDALEARLAAAPQPARASKPAAGDTEATVPPPEPPRAPEHPTISVMDIVRLRLLEARQKGDRVFQRERTAVMRSYHLNKHEFAGTWARCQGNFRPDFVRRVLRDTPTDERVEMRNRLTKLYGVSTEQIVAWYQFRNGNGGSPSATPPTSRKTARRG